MLDSVIKEPSFLALIFVLFGSIVAAVPPTLVAWATLRQSKANSDKADTIIGKATNIAVQTDGQMTKVMSALQVANEKIAGLENLIAEKNKQSDQLPLPPAPTKSKKEKR